MVVVLPLKTNVMLAGGEMENAFLTLPVSTEAVQ
jgi:hypothetical protein